MWKDIEGYEGYYQISDSGEVLCLERYIQKSNDVIQRRNEHLARIFLDKDGYQNVKLSKNGKSKIFKVHRLVAFAYVSGYIEGKEVNHKDCDRTNNKAENLEWVFHKENISYSAALMHYKNKDGVNNPNYGKHTLHKRFETNQGLRTLQSRPGKQNGRSIPVRMIYNNKSIEFDYLSQCAQYLVMNNLISFTNISYITSKISKSIKESLPFHGMMFYAL